MSDSDPPLLEVRQLTKRFPGVLALDQVEGDPGDLDPLLGEEDVDPARIGRARLAVEADGLGEGHGDSSARDVQNLGRRGHLSKPACRAEVSFL